MLGRGLTHQEIADAWERKTNIRVTRNAIASAIHRAGLSRDRTQYRFTEMWSPVKREHGMRYEMNMLRARERQLRGEELGEAVEGRLRAFLMGLKEVNGVVAYVPNTPADEDPFYILDREEFEAPGGPFDGWLLDDELPIVKKPLTRELITRIARQRYEDILAESERVVHPPPGGGRDAGRRADRRRHRPGPRRES